ncbi:hypothetical protein HK099_002513, partial [Clydaea vesicula]
MKLTFMIISVVYISSILAKQDYNPTNYYIQKDCPKTCNVETALNATNTTQVNQNVTNSSDIDNEVQNTTTTIKTASTSTTLKVIFPNYDNLQNTALLQTPV